MSGSIKQFRRCQVVQFVPAPELLVVTQDGNLLDATQLIHPHAKTSGLALELRDTEHFYLDLARLAPALSRWLNDQIG